MTSVPHPSDSSLLGNWPTLAVAALGSFLVIMDVTVVAIALPSIERDLKASFAELQWIINVALLLLHKTALATLCPSGQGFPSSIMLSSMAMW